MPFLFECFDGFFLYVFVASCAWAMRLLIELRITIGVISFAFSVVLDRTGQFLVAMSTAIFIFVGRAKSVSVTPFRRLAGKRFATHITASRSFQIFLFVVVRMGFFKAQILVVVVVVMVMVMVVPVVVSVGVVVGFFQVVVAVCVFLCFLVI